MERELWCGLSRAPRATAGDGTQEYVRHPPWVIGTVLLWAAVPTGPGLGVKLDEKQLQKWRVG
jgi:L-alanine-DL-glutamate epimerase-like enolase superfamily enzyme